MNNAKEQLIQFLVEHEDELYRAWVDRLRVTTPMGSLMMKDPSANPVRLLLRDMRRVAKGLLPVSSVWRVEMQLEPSDIVLPWRMSLCHGVEAVLTGERVVRERARVSLSLTDGEMLEVFELLNRATHQLIRFYALRYCETCRAGLTDNQAAERVAG